MKFTFLSVSVIALIAATAGQAAAAAPTPAAAADAAGATEEVIVTGTRQTGLKAVDSAAPVEVVGADALKHVGQPDLIQGLAQMVPSFTAEALGGDTANLTLSAKLRGISPNDTLVLVDGKRRHTSGNLHVLGGPYQGAATADIGLIPVAAIDHVEVLLDGAAAQYGTDAIAGVVNIILKKNAHGGAASFTGGAYYPGDGETYAGSINFGLPLGDNGFLNVTAEQRHHDYSQRGGADIRVLNNPLYDGLGLPGYPNVNHIVGDAKSTTTNLFYNGGYDFGGVEAYSFGSYSHRDARAYENYRVPGKVIASPTLGVAGNYTDPGELIFAPQGFNPKEGLVEDDYSITGGVKGDLAQWHWDLSTTYGTDQDNIHTYDSANRALYIDTHSTPTNFYDGAFITKQWTNNLDISRDFAVGLATPLTVAFGAETRNESYEIKAGEQDSYYKEGAQSFPGFQPTDAGKHDRSNYAGYIDLAASPITGLKLDLAGRYEHFSDFGDTTVGKFTARYDFNDMIAIRGTVSTGFRAPTLAEEYYSATNVSPTAAVVQLPANSAAAKVLGFGNLKPEKSNNYSVGLVLHPISKLSITLDAYQIDIKDRIVATGTIYGGGGVSNAPAVRAAIAKHNNILDPTVTYVGVSLFTNGIDTSTKGVELAANYSSDFGDLGHVDWTVAANYNETTITHIAATPIEVLTSYDSHGNLVPQSLFDKSAKSYLTTATPKEKVSLAAYYTKGKWAVNLRETIYGPSSDMVSPNGFDYYEEKIGTTGITDLEVDYAVNSRVKIAGGANNLFDTKPPNRPLRKNGKPADGSNVLNAPVGFSPFGINGGYYYGRVTFTF
ncbi:MAG: TonB-dependent receptor [Caulobacteraceae bacterium]|nr:TonB-dependent receptor [Caulobacteraceae bacterium]